MRLVVGFRLFGIRVGLGLVVGCMMTKLVGVDQSNIVAQTQIIALLST